MAFGDFLTPFLAEAQTFGRDRMGLNQVADSPQTENRIHPGTRSFEKHSLGSGPDSALSDYLHSQPSLKKRLVEMSRPHSPQLAPEKRGGVRDGGGSGVVCFGTWEQNISRNAVDDTGQLKMSYRNRVREVWLTDLFEMLQGPHSGAFNYFKPLPGEPADAYTRRLIQEHIGQYSKRFADLLNEKLNLIPFSNWEAHPEGLPFVDDIGRTENINATLTRIQHFCSFAQIVRRRFVEDPTRSQRMPLIQYDPLLLDLLKKNDSLRRDDFNYQMAMLYIHEVIYLYLHGLGHDNSILTRYVTPYLMSPNFTKLFRNPRPTNFDLLFFLDRLGMLDPQFFGIQLNSASALPGQDSPTGSRQAIYFQTLIDVFERLRNREKNNSESCDRNAPRDTETGTCKQNFIQGTHYDGRTLLNLYNPDEIRELKPAAALFIYGLIRAAEKNYDLFKVDRYQYEIEQDSRPQRPYTEDMLSHSKTVLKSIEIETCQSLKRDLKVANEPLTRYMYQVQLKSSIAFATHFYYTSGEVFRSLLELGSQACN